MDSPEHLQGPGGTSRYINGRVLHRPGGGIRRYAESVIAELGEFDVIEPGHARYPHSARIWEQTHLFEQSRSGVLVSLAHGGPLRHERHVVVVHDLFAITAPQSVRRSFAAIQQLQLPRLIERAAAVIAVSQATADDVCDRFDIDLDRLAIAPPGLDHVDCPTGDVDRCAARSALALDSDRPVVAAVLGSAQRKRSGLTANALAAIATAHPEVQLIAAVPGVPPAFVGRRAPRAPVPSAIQQLISPTDEDLFAMYRSADVVVSLPTAEGFGLVAAEAAMCGAAVVTTPVPSIAEHAPHAAVIIDAPDEADILDAVQTAAVALLDSPERRTALRAEARARLAGLRWSGTADIIRAASDRVGTGQGLRHEVAP